MAPFLDAAQLVSLDDLGALSPRELLFLNLIEKLYLSQGVLECENQRLRDEISRLKGGNAKPEFEKKNIGAVLEGN